MHMDGWNTHHPTQYLWGDVYLLLFQTHLPSLTVAFRPKLWIKNILWLVHMRDTFADLATQFKSHYYFSQSLMSQFIQYPLCSQHSTIMPVVRRCNTKRKHLCKTRDTNGDKTPSTLMETGPGAAESLNHNVWAAAFSILVMNLGWVFHHYSWMCMTVNMPVPKPLNVQYRCVLSQW